MKTRTREGIASLARRAADWPTIAATAAEYGVSPRMVKAAVSRGAVEAFVLDVCRVNPDSFAEFMAARYRPARTART